MKLLIVGFGHTKFTNFSRRVRSGGETKLLNMLPVWNKLTENNVYFLTSHSYASALSKGKPYCKLIKLPSWCEHSIFGVVGVYVKRITSSFFIRLNMNPEIIYSASDLFFDVIPSVIIKLRYKTPNLVSCVFLVAKNPFSMFYFAQQLSFLFLKRYARTVFVLNNEDRKLLIKKGFHDNSVFVTSGGVNIKEVARVKSSKTAYDTVFLGRFHPQKGLNDMVDIWELVVRSMPTKRLVIIGGGGTSIVNRLKEDIARRRLTKSITLLVNQERNDILSLLKSASVFAFPSHHESWGFVVAEAMACGLPVVSYKLPYMQTIFRQGIRYVKPFNTAEFAKQIQVLLINSKIRNVLAKQAFEQSKAFDWQKVAIREYSVLEMINRV